MEGDPKSQKKQFVVADSRNDRKKRVMTPLKQGEAVMVQNQHGNKPKRGSNTGIVVETHTHQKYGVMIHGSRRLTIRNRKF